MEVSSADAATTAATDGLQAAVPMSTTAAATEAAGATMTVTTATAVATGYWDPMTGLWVEPAAAAPMATATTTTASWEFTSSSPGGLNGTAGTNTTLTGSPLLGVTELPTGTLTAGASATAACTAVCGAFSSSTWDAAHPLTITYAPFPSQTLITARLVTLPTAAADADTANATAAAAAAAACAYDADTDVAWTSFGLLNNGTALLSLAQGQLAAAGAATSVAHALVLQTENGSCVSSDATAPVFLDAAGLLATPSPTPSPTPNTPKIQNANSSGSSNTLSGGVIALIVILCVILALFMGSLWLYRRRSIRQAKAQEDADNGYGGQPHAGKADVSGGVMAQSDEGQLRWHPFVQKMRQGWNQAQRAWNADEEAGHGYGAGGAHGPVHLNHYAAAPPPMGAHGHPVSSTGAGYPGHSGLSGQPGSSASPPPGSDRGHAAYEALFGRVSRRTSVAPLHPPLVLRAHNQDPAELEEPHAPTSPARSSHRRSQSFVHAPVAAAAPWRASKAAGSVKRQVTVHEAATTASAPERAPTAARRTQTVNSSRPSEAGLRGSAVAPAAGTARRTQSQMRQPTQDGRHRPSRHVASSDLGSDATPTNPALRYRESLYSNLGSENGPASPSNFISRPGSPSGLYSIISKYASSDVGSTRSVSMHAATAAAAMAATQRYSRHKPRVSSQLVPASAIAQLNLRDLGDDDADADDGVDEDDRPLGDVLARHARRGSRVVQGELHHHHHPHGHAHGAQRVVIVSPAASRRASRLSSRPVSMDVSRGNTVTARQGGRSGLAVATGPAAGAAAARGPVSADTGRPATAGWQKLAAASEVPMPRVPLTMAADAAAMQATVAAPAAEPYDSPFFRDVPSRLAVNPSTQPLYGHAAVNRS
ncbi:hypothetical protein CXG81DRAFT_24675 [Caulochytrium protostelioides]|uniref:Uncharacterized protein n=1 Tax=Caulochytrium protostelioides TaxID=1555241 RepID=A0A4P9XC30_9FUNG|nr:hypothetical protein CXG81DRAFT_24675 [Caulochytrium protostelioides]|eukprot:RKP02710.1 hypothetical protein CXG81DRAFT_24675 [Caulochytrium protostelioides]